MFVVDTNILVYGANEQSEHHGRCLTLLAEWREQSSAWFLTWATAGPRRDRPGPRLREPRCELARTRRTSISTSAWPRCRCVA